MRAPRISVLGAGAFGTALAIALSTGKRAVMLWGRDAPSVARMATTRANPRYLPGVTLPTDLVLTDSLAEALQAETILLAVPAQQLAGFLQIHGPDLAGKTLVACCKGVDRASGLGPASLLARTCPEATVAILTGPSFAADIARGLPTAMTLACADAVACERLQHLLDNPTIRIYRTTDVIGAELGGALKNVVAIAAGLVIGHGLGDSARAALMTRGYAEMVRFARTRGARAETLAGLSGLGDMVLTCTSSQSRNFAFGVALARHEPLNPHTTVEGVATAKALMALVDATDLEMPVTEMVALVTDHMITVGDAMTRLVSRTLKEE